MPALRSNAAPSLHPDFQRVRDLALTLSHEPEQLLPTIAFLNRTYPQRDALLDLSLSVRKQALRLEELAREGRSQRAGLTAQADQLLAALEQMKQAAGDLRDAAEAQEAVVTFGKAIQLQGKIAVMECLTKMLLFALE